MSWSRRNRVKSYDKRDSYLILRMTEMYRETILNTSGCTPAQNECNLNPIERDLLRDLANLETKARAEWVK